MKDTDRPFDDYLANLPAERKIAMEKLAETVRNNIPEGFTEMMQYNMPSWSISLQDYPPGYHCTPDTPLPFLSMASQKNFIALYHMGIYMNSEILDWFTAECPKHSKRKLDMGKSCIRFKKPEEIPFDLIGELMTKITPEDYISVYEKNLKR